MNRQEIAKALRGTEYDFLVQRPELGDNIILLGLGGSHAYGTNVEGSDCEHFWRRPGATKYQPEYEFMVYQGEVMGYRTGNWTDVELRYRSEEGPIELIDIILRADKHTIFDNPRDAALYAQELTNEYLKHWGWVWSSGMWPDMPPMPRRWEKYLKEDTENG